MRYWWVIPGVLLAVAFAGVLQQNTKFQKQLGRAELASARAEELTSSLTQVVRAAQTRAAILEDSLGTVLAQQKRVRVKRDTVTQTVIVQAPAECAPVVEQLQQVTQDRDAALSLAEAMRQVSDSLWSVHRADSAMLEAERLAHRESLAAAHAAPGAPVSFFKRLVPTIGMGASAGYALGAQQPDIVIGLTVSWEITP